MTFWRSVYVFFWLRSQNYQAEWIKQASGRVNEADDLMNSLAFSIRYDHHDAITETLPLSICYSLFIGSLFSLADFVASTMTSEKNWWFWKARHVSLSPFYIGFVPQLYRNCFFGWRRCVTGKSLILITPAVCNKLFIQVKWEKLRCEMNPNF